jgi:hypothetical protein
VNIEAHKKCRENERCVGPGCRVETGKTKRKANWNRPKRNKNEGSRI